MKVYLKFISCSIILFVSESSPLKAAEYLVEWTKSGAGNGIVAFNFLPRPTNWHTVSDPLGVELINPDSLPIKCIRIKAVSAGVLFRLAPLTADSVFPTVWMRKGTDNSKGTTEVVFMDGNIQPSDIVRNRVTDTSGATGLTGEIFEGQLFRDNVTLPDPANWTQLTPFQPTNYAGSPGKLKPLVQSLPNGYSAINAYTESADGKSAFFTSRGFPFIYNFTSNELRPIILNKILTKSITQIKITGQNVELWSNEIKLDSIALSDEKRIGVAMQKRGVK